MCVLYTNILYKYNNMEPNPILAPHLAHKVVDPSNVGSELLNLIWCGGATS